MKVNLAWKAPVFFYTIPHNITPAYPYSSKITLLFFYFLGSLFGAVNFFPSYG